MTKPNQSGFSLIELMFVVIILGTMIAMSVPTMKGFRQSYNLRSATENVAGQLTLARQKAMAVDSTQIMHFGINYMGCDYHIHNNNVMYPTWTLPNGVVFYLGAGTRTEFRMKSDGRCMDSGMVILEDVRGVRDTVSVLASGLILLR